MNNNAALTVIAVALVGIFAMMAWDHYNKPEPANIVEKISNDMSEFGEEVRDEIDDHTTN